MAADPNALLPAAMLVAGLGMMLVVGLAGLALFGGGAAAKAREKRLSAVLRRAQPEVRAAGPSLISARSTLNDSAIPQLDQLIKRLLPRRSEWRRRLQLTGRHITAGQYMLGMVVSGVAAALALAVFARTAASGLPALGHRRRRPPAAYGGGEDDRRAAQRLHRPVPRDHRPDRARPPLGAAGGGIDPPGRHRNGGSRSPACSATWSIR